jgi:hypothetical protein
MPSLKKLLIKRLKIGLSLIPKEIQIPKEIIEESEIIEDDKEETSKKEKTKEKRIKRAIKENFEELLSALQEEQYETIELDLDWRIRTDKL